MRGEQGRQRDRNVREREGGRQSWRHKRETRKGEGERRENDMKIISINLLINERKGKTNNISGVLRK